MATSEEAQQTKYTAIATCIIVLTIVGLWAFYIWCDRAYSNKSYADSYDDVIKMYRSVDKRTEESLKKLEYRISELEQFAKSLKTTITIQERLPKE